MRSVLRAATVVAVVAAMVGAATLAGAFATTPTPAAAPSALQDAEPTLNRTYGGQFADSGSAVVELNGSYALVGSSNRSARGDAVSDVVVRRVDANGSVVWTSTVERPGSQRPTDAARTPGGGIVVVGTTGTGDSRDGFAARLGPDGELVWYRGYGTPGPDTFNGVVAAEGGFAVAGATAGTDGDDSAWLVRLDGDGVQQFARTYERQASAARDIARAGDGYVLAGRLTRSVPRQSDDQVQAWAARVAPNGNVRWTSEYGTESTNETAAAVVSTADGYALAGESRPTDGDSEARGWYAGLAENGTERWTRSYGSRRGAFSDVATAGEDLVLVGTLGPRATADVTVVRARADGTPTQSYVAGPGESVIARDALAGNDSVVVAGTLTAGGDSQAWLLGTATPGSVTTPTTTTPTTVNRTTTATTSTATPTTSPPTTATPSTTTPTTSTPTSATTSTTAPTDTTTTTATTTTSDGLPGFTAPLAVVALLAAALLAVRRR